MPIENNNLSYSQSGSTNAKYFDLTKSQLMIWLGQQLSPFLPLYNMAFTYLFSVRIDVEQFQKAFQKLVQQSDAMRSCFEDKDGRPKQLIRKNLAYQMEFLDFSQKENPKKSVENYMDLQIKKVFHIQDILFDSILIKLADEKYLWYLNQHHLITDGWSITIQYEQMLANYQQLLNGNIVLDNSLPSYEDFVIFETNKRATENIYWKNKLETLAEFPSFFSKHNPLANTMIHRKRIRLNKEKTRQLRKFMKEENLRTWSEDLSLFTFFLTILYLSVFKISAQSNLAIGTPIHNRNRPNFKKTIGVFIELFPISISIEATDTFQSLFEKVRNEYYQFLRHDHVGKSSAALSKKFNVVLNYINASYPKIEEIPMQSEWLNSGHADAGHHLKLQVYNFDNTGEIEFFFDGNTSLFSHNQLEQVADHFMEMVDSFGKDQSQAIHFLTAQESEQLQHFNDTNFDFPKEETIVSWFEKIVIQKPAATAIVFEDQKMSYHQLNEKSNQLAHFLIAQGIEKEDLVGICLDRSFEMMIGVMGILKSGAAYVPIDPNYPASRIDYIIDDIQAKVVLCTQASAHFFNEKNSSVVVLNQDWERIPNNIHTKPLIKLSSQNLMYVIYTSGSTGKPKGVMNEHGALVNRLQWAQQYFEIKQDVFLQKTSFSFDVSVWELFLPLITGSTLVLASPNGEKDNIYLKKIIEKKGLSIVHFVPPMLEVFLLDIEKGDCSKLKKVICSGEALKEHQIQLFQKKLPHVTLYNLYGPTEAAIDVTAYKIPKPFEAAIVSIGKPVANTQIFILNSLGMQCPIGVAGELYIGGIQVARGYYNRCELTKEKFVELRLNNQKKKLYKTGDLAMWMPDGNINFLGRLDTQVKIRGFRVETSGVEAVLSELEGVEQPVVLVKTDHFGNNYLVAYFVGNNNSSSTQILKKLKTKLPNYMLPTHLVMLEKIPMSTNGKIDRAVLPDPNNLLDQQIKYIAPQTEFEEIIQEIWIEVMQINQIGVSDNFIELGGDSLTAIRVMSRINKAFELNLPVNLIFQKLTIAQLATEIEETIMKMLQELEDS